MRKKEIVVFLTAVLVIMSVGMIVFSSLWSYLENSTALAPLYKDITRQRQAQLASRGKSALSPVTPSLTPTQVGTPPTTYLGYTANTFTDGKNSLIYYLYIPADYNPARKYPLVLLLHGGGERANPKKPASQNEKLLLNDPYASVWSASYTGAGNPHIQQNWPSFIVIPQMTLSEQWVNVNVHLGSYVQSAQPSLPLQLTKELLDSLQLQYQGIDASRLYVTGLSNGGLGTWDAIERWPDYFAAAAPIAGAGDPSKAAVLKNLPIWAFHGSADPTIPVSGSRTMIAAIEAAGGQPRYTEFAGQGHGVWPYVYSLNTSSLRVTGFFTWLFAQHKAT